MRDPAVSVRAQTVMNMDSPQFETGRLFTQVHQLMQQNRGIQAPAKSHQQSAVRVKGLLKIGCGHGRHLCRKMPGTLPGNSQRGKRYCW